MSTPEPKLTLVYFPIAGRAEAIRLTAAAGGLPFTNKVLTFPEFGEEKTKDTLPLGQLPILEIESFDSQQEGSQKTTTTRTTSQVVTQTSAILRFVGKKIGLYPTDDEMKALKVDEYICILLDDLLQPLINTLFGAVKMNIRDMEWTDEEKLKIHETWMETALPRFVGKIEKDLKDSDSGWLVGDSVTIADIRLFTDLAWIESGILGTCY